MEIITGIFGNYIIKVAFLAWLTAQVLKTIINYCITKDWSLERLVGAGGMPSSHTAFVVSAAIATARQCGTASTEFAIIAIIAGVVIYDAMGVRRAAGKQAGILNQLIYSNQVKVDTNEKLKELIGHTPKQVFVGALWGIVLGIIFA